MILHSELVQTKLREFNGKTNIKVRWTERDGNLYVLLPADLNNREDLELMVFRSLFPDLMLELRELGIKAYAEVDPYVR